MYQPKVNDSVSGTLTGVDFTGTVTDVFVGFCQVKFDQPLGANRITSTLISTSKLTLLNAAPDFYPAAPIYPAPMDAPERTIPNATPLSVLESPDTAE